LQGVRWSKGTAPDMLESSRATGRICPGERALSRLEWPFFAALSPHWWAALNTFSSYVYIRFRRPAAGRAARGTIRRPDPALPGRPAERRRISHAAAAERPVHPAPCTDRSEEHTSELQSRENLVCRLLLEKKKISVKWNR